MAASSTIIQLREHLAARFPGTAPQAERFIAGEICGLEDSLPHGFPRSTICEIISQSSNGLLLNSIFQSAQRENLFLALIDAHDTLDLQSLPAEMLSRFLWVRCKGVEQAIQAADLVLRDGNLPLVLLNLCAASRAELRQVPTRNWYRLQRIVEQEESALVALTPTSVVGAARIKLQVKTQLDLAAFDRPRQTLIAELKAASLRAWQAPLSITA